MNQILWDIFLFLRFVFDLKAIRYYRQSATSGDLKIFENDRFEYHVDIALDDISQLSGFNFFSRLNFDVTYHKRFNYSNDTAWYFKVGLRGSDSYNIYFEDKFWFYEFGVSTGKFFFNN